MRTSNSLKLMVVTCAIVGGLCSDHKHLRSQWETQMMRENVQASPTDSAIGFAIGPILFLMSFVLIWYNEKRAVKDYTRLKIVNRLLSEEEGMLAERALSQSVHKNIENRKQLAYRSGPLSIIKEAYDDVAGIHIPNAIKISREVHVREYRSYRKSKDQLICQLSWVSANQSVVQTFNNPTHRWKFTNSETFNSQVELKGIKLSEKLKDQLSYNHVFEPTTELAENIKRFAGYDEALTPVLQTPYLYFPGTEGDIESHGTLRVKFSYCSYDEATIISSIDKEHSEYQPFRIDKYQNKGRQDTIPCEGQSMCCLCVSAGKIMKPISEVSLIRPSIISQQDLIAEELRKSKAITNILRLITFLMMVGGIYLFFTPIVDILGYIPIVGGFLKRTVGYVVLIGALIISVPLFLVTFSLAWLRYHPKVSITLLIVVAIIAGVIIALDQTLQS